MSPLLYAVSSRLFQILANVGVGTNLGLYQIFFALLSGRLLESWGALFPALCDSGLLRRNETANLMNELCRVVASDAVLAATARACLLKSNLGWARAVAAQADQGCSDN